jgi:hypothetical protein
MDKQQGDDFRAACEHRTAGRDIFGPLDDHLPEVRIPAEVKVDAMRAASKLGLDLTAWIRELVYESIYGADHIGMLYQQRAERVRGNARQRDSIPIRVVDQKEAPRG